MGVKLKQAYEAPNPRDEFRALVHRLWPRGVSKNSPRSDCWLKEIAPSTALRKWLSHDPAKWTEFRDRYFRELDEHSDAVKQLVEYVHHGTVTLVHGARDQEHPDAVALKEYLESDRPHSSQRRD